MPSTGPENASERSGSEPALADPEAGGPDQPLRFRPILKQRVWGGRRLESLLGKALPGPGPYGESWEIADCGEDRSVVDGGPWCGRDLHGLVTAHPRAVLGRDGAEFPLLLKNIDAAAWLSVQVHPGGEAGTGAGEAARSKTEAWVILDAPPGARIVYGLAEGVEREDLFRAAARGAGPEIERLLGWREVRAGDVVFLPAGTIHAIGPGILLLEVQENSDTTYRIYDWGRPGLDGQPRRLHLEEARQVRPPPGGIACPYARIGGSSGSGEPLIESRAFRLGALRLAPDGSFAGSTGDADREPVVLAGIEGRAVVGGGRGGPPVELGRGEFALLPAALGAFAVRAGAGGFTGLWVGEGRPGRI